MLGFVPQPNLQLGDSSSRRNGTKEITPSPYQGEGWGGVKPGDITPTLNLGLFPYTLVLPPLSPP